MGRETDNGHWESKPTIIFPFDIGGKHYVYSLSDTKWFIKELLPNGKMGSETDHGTWKYHYTIGFPFSINGRQYFYCVSEKYWFIQELVPGGKMGKETDNGYWKTNHILNVPFIIDGKNYFYGLTDNDTRYWFIQELLPAGKMGPEKMYGTWEHYYEVVFAFNINGRQFLYRLSEYSWFIQEIIKEPRFPTRTVEKEKYCNPESVLRNKQDNNCTCNAEYGVTGLNVLEGYITDIENDNDNYLTMTYSYPDFPILSVSTFRVAADANNARFIELTAAIRAEIHYSHMFQIRCPIVSAEVRAHLQQMNREDDDEAGHLLASSLGGSGLPYNFAPQSPMLKRVQCVNVSGSVISQPGWYDVEELLRNYLLSLGKIAKPHNCYASTPNIPLEQLYCLQSMVSDRRAPQPSGQKTAITYATIKASRRFCKRPGECRCKLGFYGDKCNKCIAMPGCLHGYCNVSFECISTCRSDCHSSRGYCEQPGECRCRFGWTGPTCRDCQPLPGCQHGYCDKPLECNGMSQRAWLLQAAGRVPLQGGLDGGGLRDLPPLPGLCARDMQPALGVCLRAGLGRHAVR
ncbi:Uncharacterized protein OBRU01_07456 [Operophtera brumata]|uniref:EGF-like domain-containing protein n=1 Tax=Operophtera brumata TaxID=104452 RepID=A0A0L7LAH8_OPEBR|nr:Uncharacterized protein OBRU01_07456 [Operophtera brumata]